MPTERETQLGPTRRLPLDITACQMVTSRRKAEKPSPVFWKVEDGAGREGQYPRVLVPIPVLPVKQFNSSNRAEVATLKALAQLKERLVARDDAFVLGYCTACRKVCRFTKSYSRLRS